MATPIDDDPSTAEGAAAASPGAAGGAVRKEIDTGTDDGLTFAEEDETATAHDRTAHYSDGRSHAPPDDDDPDVPYPRTTTPPPAPKRRSTLLTVAWAASFAVLWLLGVTGYARRDDLMHHWPASKRVYGMLGLVHDAPPDSGQPGH